MARLDFGSRDLIEQSAQCGGSDALFELGLMYSAGRDVAFDMVASHKWFNLAALRGNKEAKVLRQEIDRDMTRPQIAEAQRQAQQWLPSN